MCENYVPLSSPSDLAIVFQRGCTKLLWVCSGFARGSIVPAKISKRAFFLHGSPLRRSPSDRLILFYPPPPLWFNFFQQALVVYWLCHVFVMTFSLFTRSSIACKEISPLLITKRYRVRGDRQSLSRA